jgi:predicted DNA-binding transcriptional regulator YafY
MLSTVLNSERAIRVNIEIMRAFVRLRQILASNAQLARRLNALEKKYDAQFKVVFDAIPHLMAPPEPDGGILFEIEVSEPKEVGWWVLQWGAEVEVLKPETLREELRQTAKGLAVLYGRGVGQHGAA